MRLFNQLSQKFLSLPLFISLFPSLIRGYTIDSSCNSHDLAGVRSSILEALNIAAYASFRMTENDPKVGEVLSQFLGANGKASLIDRMNKVPAAIGTDTGMYHAGVFDDTVVFDCGAGNLVKRQAVVQGGDPYEWTDARFPSMAPIGEKDANVQSACGPLTTAFTYDTNDLFGPKSVIVLCTGAAGTLSRNKRIGDLWKTGNWYQYPYDSFIEYTSTTLVHEFMHALRDGILSVLPSGAGETYSWADIKALSDADKVANAQSYSGIASAMWLNRNTMGASGAMGRRFSQNNRPGMGPHFT